MMEDKCEYCGEEVETIKQEYEKLSKKYKLPNFKELNEDFDVGKIDCCNTETILRDLRKIMVGKFASLLQLVELLLNPSNGSMFHMFLVKGVNGNEKEDLNKLFQILGTIQIDSFSLDISYSEKAESNFIISSFKSWNEIKPLLITIINSLKKNWKEKTNKKNKSYFG